MKITREPFSPQPRKFYDEEGNAFYAYEGPTPLCAGVRDAGVDAFLDDLAEARARTESPGLTQVLDSVDRELRLDTIRGALERQNSFTDKEARISDEELDAQIQALQSAYARAWNKRLDTPVPADYVYPERPGFREGQE